MMKSKTDSNLPERGQEIAILAPGNELLAYAIFRVAAGCKELNPILLNFT
jgi:hypothetical protein